MQCTRNASHWGAGGSSPTGVAGEAAGPDLEQVDAYMIQHKAISYADSRSDVAAFAKLTALATQARAS